MLIKPGLAADISSISLSLFFINLINSSAIIKGLFLLLLDKTIATFEDMSHLKLAGGISTFIPSRLSGNSIKPSLFNSLTNSLILSRYKSNMFIKYFYVN